MYRVECFDSACANFPRGNLYFRSSRRAKGFSVQWTRGNDRFIRIFYHGDYGVVFVSTIQHGRVTYLGGYI